MFRLVQIGLGGCASLRVEGEDLMEVSLNQDSAPLNRIWINLVVIEPQEVRRLLLEGVVLMLVLSVMGKPG